MSSLSIGIIGFGYWGPNLARNFSVCPLTEVAAICDIDPQRLKEAGRVFDTAHLTTSLEEVLTLDIDAVVIATPVSTHFDVAQYCLRSGRHVLIEKPLAASVAQAEALVALAKANDCILMVDHTYLFANPIQTIKKLIEHDELGELYYVDSIRINLGLFQHDVNVIWDLASHDLSIVDHIIGRDPSTVAAWGCAHADPNIENIAYVNVSYTDRLIANFHVNWLSPVKIRQMIFAGKRKSLVFNELDPNEPIMVYDRGIELTGSGRQRKLQIGYRSGDVWCPNVEPGEPLQSMVTHFAQCILDGHDCISDGRFGLRIVRYLDAATQSLTAQGVRVPLLGILDGDRYEYDQPAKRVSANIP